MTTIHSLPENFNAAQDCLKGKIILVTGAGDGIGRAAALSYAEHGATVILLGKTLEKLEAVYDEIEKKSWPQPALCPFDLNSTHTEQYKEIAKTINENFGHLDGLLHNAGILGDRASIAAYKSKLWLDTMQVNVNAPFMLTQALLPLLRNSQHTSIIFTSSGVGRQGRAFWGAYAVSKFATEGLMQTLADEQEQTSQIRVNCINPGPTCTQMRATAYPAENPATLRPPEALMPLYLYLMSEASIGSNGKTFDA
jgi:NAD(P)-dependent dehydrogenase (short-subunit alcohol dehydrogenase family)